MNFSWPIKVAFAVVNMFYLVAMAVCFENRFYIGVAICILFYLVELVCFVTGSFKE